MCAICGERVLIQSVEPGLGEDYEKCHYCGRGSFLMKYDEALVGTFVVYEEIPV